MKIGNLLKTMLLVGVMFLTQQANAQVVMTENFDYTEGTTLVSNGWVAHSGEGTNSPIVAPGLTFEGYMGTGIGGAAALTKTGEDVHFDFEGQSGENIYAAFLVSLGSTNSNGYFFHFAPSPFATTYFSRVWTNAEGTGIGIGASPESYVSVTPGTPTLVVVKLNIATKVSSLFVFDTFPTEEPATADASFTETASFTAVGAVGLRQFNASQNITVDAIRVASTWADAVMAAGEIEDTEGPVATFIPANNATDVALEVAPSITFNEAILSTQGTEVMDADLFSLITFVDQDANAVGFNATINVAKTVVTLTPSITLAENTTYTLSVGAVEDALGNESEPQMASFTTLSSDPTVTITSPVNGAEIIGTEATIEFLVENFTIGATDAGVDGHLHYTLDAEPMVMQYTTDPIVLTELAAGEHTVVIELVDNAHASLNPQVTTSVTFTMLAETIVSIHDIQFTEEGSGDSPYKDQIVTTTGIVTGVAGTSSFYVQDGTGLWNGIYVYKGTQDITMPAVGDEIQFRAKVVEYYNLTEMKNIEYINVISSNNELPAATPVTAAELTEPTEGILVSATNYLCVHDGDGNYWNSKYVDADVPTGTPTDTLLVYRQMYNDFLPTVGKTYSFTGLVAFDFGAFKIAPRNADDVIESQENIAPAISEVAIYPTEPVVGAESFVQATITDDGGQDNLVKTFFYGFDEESVTNELTMTPIGVAGTRFLATIPAMETATAIYFRIVANDGELETEYNGSYNIIAGINDAVSTSFMMYPNPASDKLIVENAQAGRYVVMNVSGQVVLAGQIVSGQNEINIDNMSNGLYIINIVNANGQSNAQSFIKK